MYPNKFSAFSALIISDVINLLRKYDLFYILQDYVLHGRFPLKCIWKRYINTRISSYFVNEWNERTNAPEFELYRQIQQLFSVSPVWNLAKYNKSIMLSVYFSVAQMIASDNDIFHRLDLFYVWNY